ncbi:peroxiredoxin [Citromicrobium bathyomarinum]|uniref:peroxiredoxin n=1 Tax=Sphingomonadales TaxID=204457 RepID=UPI000C4066B0|nr:peroxiredoxin [Citromicrobium sp.]MBO80914.1 peroxiredoxin [Citromicrobium sp.]|tara:strand:- start:190 stop:657 length:468 start_codon:yes stop_codon:yes gene_type:complete
MSIGEGDTMPDIAMVRHDGKEVKPSDYRGRKLVLFFYPKDNTPGCTTEAKDFSALKPEFEKAGVALLGISKDSSRKHQNFIAKHDLTVDLATDAEEDGLSDKLGVWAEKKMYGKTFMGMVRSTYLLNADGTIARIWPKVKVNGHAQEVLEAARET